MCLRCLYLGHTRLSFIKPHIGLIIFETTPTILFFLEMKLRKNFKKIYVICVKKKGRKIPISLGILCCYI